MAQPVFDEHPLEQYLKEVGETSSMMPGGLENDQEETIEKLLHGFLEPVISVVASQSFNAFVERFKYNVISSSLLSNTLTTTSHGHSRSSSIETTTTTHSFTSQYSIFSIAIALVIILIGAGYYISSLLSGAFLLYIFTTNVTTPSLDTLDDLIAAGNLWDSVVQEVMTTLEQDEKRMTYSSSAPTSPRSSLRVTLHSTLLTTQNQCDNIRQLLSALTSQTELSQLSHMYAPPSPPPPNKNSFLSSTSYSLSLTNRRRSVSNPNLRQGNKRATWNGSYASLANAGSPTMQITKRREKRRSDLSALLHLAPTSPSSSSPRFAASAPVTPHGDDDEEAEEDSAALEGVAEEDVVPEGGGGGGSGGRNSSDSETSDEGEQRQQQFGFAALELQRRRKSSGLRVLSGGSFPQTPSKSDVRTPPGTTSSYRPPQPPPPPPVRHFQSLSSPRFGSTRFTSPSLTMIGSRHPLSLSALHVALSNAIASKRYACSYLLALRFKEEREDEQYWEDVKSVMGLLTSTFADASGRLNEALEEVERERLRDEVPSPPPPPAGEESGTRRHRRRVVSGSGFSSSSSSSSGSGSGSSSPLGGMGGIGIGFAPMPSHVARFAAHVDAISSALDDARKQLKECVASLREGEEEVEEDGSNSHHRSSSHEHGDVDDDDGGEHLHHSHHSHHQHHHQLHHHHQERKQHPALEAYERLRRELGLALRECERGREPLSQVVFPTRTHHHHPLSDEEELPGLGHDIRSDGDESDGKPDSMENETGSGPLVSVVDPSGGGGGDHEGHEDDVTSHLLMSCTSEHLPLPGVEQVYEGSSGLFLGRKREKTKLSREERIEMVRKARESGGRDLSGGLVRLEEEVGGGGGGGGGGGVDKWGPGGDVVQELKDVIWKVSEKRRKLGGGGEGDDSKCSQSAPPILRAGMNV